MKQLFRIGVISAVVFSFAGIFAEEVLSVPALPSPQYLDTEVVTNIPFKSWEDGLVKFDYSIVFHTSASNNVEMSFGADANNDGILAREEAALALGWDCGEWFVENVRTGEKVTGLPIGDYGLHEFACEMNLCNAGRKISKVTYADNMTPLFQSIADAKPSWLYSKSWDLLRIVARGDNVRGNESFWLGKSIKGLRIIFK